MDIARIIEVCKAYDNLGWSIKEQLTPVLDNRPLQELVETGELNSNALQYIQSFLEILQDSFNDCSDNDNEIDFLSDLIHEIEIYRR